MINIDEEKKIIRNAEDDFLGFLDDDYTQVGYLAAYIRRSEPSLKAEDVKRLTKDVIRDLIEKKGIYHVRVTTEQREDIPLEKVMDEIDDMFRITNGNPGVGDGIWFGRD